jgi:hypothetical protein
MLVPPTPTAPEPANPPTPPQPSPPKPSIPPTGRGVAESPSEGLQNLGTGDFKEAPAGPLPLDTPKKPPNDPDSALNDPNNTYYADANRAWKELENLFNDLRTHLATRPKDGTAPNDVVNAWNTRRTELDEEIAEKLFELGRYGLDLPPWNPDGAAQNPGGPPRRPDG